MDQHIQEVEKLIVDAIVLGLEKEQVQEKDLPKIADFVLNRIDLIKTQEQMIKFVDELSLRWSIFENIRQMELGSVKKVEEKQIAQQALNLIKNGKFKEATNLTAQITK